MRMYQAVVLNINSKGKRKTETSTAESQLRTLDLAYVPFCYIS
jgi:hypothetical protein